MSSPFDLWVVEIEEAPRGTITLKAERGTGKTAAVLEPGRWGIEVRPDLPADALAAYEAARRPAAAGPAEGLAMWRALAKRRDLAATTRAWAFTRIAALLDATQQWDEADAAADEASRLLRDSRHRAAMLLARGRALRLSGHNQKAREVLEAALHRRDVMPPSLTAAALHQVLSEIGVFGEGLPLAQEHIPRALDLARRFAPGSLVEADALQTQCTALMALGDLGAAEEACRAALSIRQAVMPDGVETGQGLRLLGMVVRMRGRLDEAESLYTQSLDHLARVAPEGAEFATTLGGLGLVAWDRGDLVKATASRTRAAAILERLGPAARFDLATQYNGLGMIAYARGDLDAAEDWFSKAHAIFEVAAPRSVGLGMFIMNLGEVALRRGDLATADSRLRQALTFYEPGSRYASWALIGLGDTAERRGDWTAAEAFLKQALAIEEKDAPEGLDHSSCVQSLGRVAQARGDLGAAKGLYEHALRIRQRLAPGTQYHAESLHALGVIARKGGRLQEAEDLLRRAAEALEAQKGRLGGAEDVQSGFAARYADFYQDLMELLVQRGDPQAAFDVLERSRARRLLTLMAERDLFLEDDIPRALEQERRRVAAEYERTHDALRRLNADKDTAQIDRIATQVRELRDRQAAIAARIREASPHLAEFSDPQPLDTRSIQASFEGGAVLLAYSVGKEKTLLFVVSPERVEASIIPLGQPELRERIHRWRRWAEQTAPPVEFTAESQALYDLLIGPAERRVRTSRRLLISPDGPLHRLPFAALRRPDGYLAESKALSIVPSGTIHARMARSAHPTAYASDLVAFGDPRYTDRDPLPASRREVETLAERFPASTVHLGDEATEERAKAIGRGARYVHFACHGLIDERFPLDSALALSAPPGGAEGRDNGLLHAWEIFERVRLDADLVTLSACHSAAGSELAGEGLIGLTRAFQYAGARSILASLWSVGDKSTLELMVRFYDLLKAGLPKDEALRATQVEAIRQGRHPVRWATFQLYGDWR